MPTRRDILAVTALAPIAAAPLALAPLPKAGQMYPLVNLGDGRVTYMAFDGSGKHEIKIGRICIED